MTRTEQQRFSRRFCLEDWQFLCSKVEFLDALDRSAEEAEVVAHRLLDPETAAPATEVKQ